MLPKFGPFKWAMVQWTAYITLIWTFQMEKGLMDDPFYDNLDHLKWTTYIKITWTIHISSIWAVQIEDGPLDHLYYGNMYGKNKCFCFALKWFMFAAGKLFQWTTYITLIWTV